MDTINDKKILNTYEIYGSVRLAAEALGISKSNFQRRLKQANDNEAEFVLNSIPEDDIPVEMLVDQLHERFKQRKKHKEAKHWHEVQTSQLDYYGMVSPI